MTFKPDELKKTKDEVSIVWVCDQLYLPRKGNSFQCFNPSNHTHGDKDFSCSIDVRRNKFCCWVCGFRGDVVYLVSKKLGVTTDIALGWIQDKIKNSSTDSWKIESFQPSELTPTDIEKDKLRTQIYEDFISHCQPVCDRSKGKDFIQSRLISDNIALEYDLRYLAPPQYTEVASYLEDKYELSILQWVGLHNIKPQNRGNLRFGWRHHVIIPVKKSGKIVYIISRAINPKVKIKYLNLCAPLTVLFNEDILTNLPEEFIVYLAEGPLDALTLISHGFDSVGMFGSFTGSEKLLKQLFSYKIVLVFDSDPSGKLAIKYLTEYFTKNEVDVSVLELPSGYHSVLDLLKESKDIESYIKPLN